MFIGIIIAYKNHTYQNDLVYLSGYTYKCFKKDYKKVSKWMSLCCIVGCNLATVMDSVKFEFNDIISLYKKYDS